MIGWLLGEESEAGICSSGGGENSGQKETRSGFRCVIDTDVGRDVAAVYAFEEVQRALSTSTKTGDVGEEGIKMPILTSACPGFICYAEAVHPYLIPHLSRLKSPQAILGTFVKTVLSKMLGGNTGPKDIYVVGVQPCFDKKLEAARGELTNAAWNEIGGEGGAPVRDVDCVITTRELITLAEECGVDFASLPKTKPPVESDDALSRIMDTAFPSEFIYTPTPSPSLTQQQLQPQQPLDQSPTPASHSLITGASGGYLHYILLRLQSIHPGSTITVTRGRNSDTVEYTLLSAGPSPVEIIKLARSYGFRNIQNLVRKLKPVKKRVLPRFSRGNGAGQVVLEGRRGGGGNERVGYAYVEVMACPGGCTNGGGQVKAGDRLVLGAERVAEVGGKPAEGDVSATAQTFIQKTQKEWLAKVDEAYWSSDDSEITPTQPSSSSPPLPPQNQLQSSPTPSNQNPFNISPPHITSFVTSWSDFTGISIEKLLYTGYRKVEDEFNKGTRDDQEDGRGVNVRAAAELAGKVGGGW